MAMAVREDQRRHQPWLQTRTAVLMLFVGLIALWSAVSLLFYLEIP